MSRLHQSERVGPTSDRWFRRVVWVAIAVCGVLVALEVGRNLRVALDIAWNDALVAPAVAMLRGVPLWSPHGKGPELDMIYGPVAALTWVPAALQSTPTRAIVVGLLEAFLLTLLPVVWIVHTEARHHPTVVASTLLLGLAFLVSTPVLPGFSIHADAPAFGFSTLALACAWTEDRRQHASWRWAGAAAVVVAVGSKQVMVPLLAAYPAWIALASGWRTGVRTLQAIAAVGALSLALVVWTVDVQSMVAATIVGLSRQPWHTSDPVGSLSAAAFDLVRRALPATVLLALAAVVLRRRGATWQAWAQSNRWLFPLVVALACIPTAVLGRAKYGGGTNTLVSVWFAWAAMLAAYATASHRGPVARRTLTTVAVVVSCVLAVRAAPRLETLPGLLRDRPVPSVAFDAARQAPGRIYFPFRPTVALMADGRADHSTEGIRFGEIRGNTVDDSYVRAFLPPALERVATDGPSSPYVLNYLPQFRRQILDPSLPGWIVLMADDLLAPGDEPGPAVTERRDPRTALPTQALTWPDAPARLRTARVLLPERERRHRVRLEATIDSTTVHASLDVEVLLRDRAGRHLLTLAASATPDAAGGLVVEWPVFDEFVWSVERTLVLVRGGQPADGGERWRLSPEQARWLVRVPDEAPDSPSPAA